LRKIEKIQGFKLCCIYTFNLSFLEEMVKA